MNQIFAFTVACLITALMSACSNEVFDDIRPGVILFDDLESYQSIEATLSKLKMEYRDIAVLEDTSLTDNDKRPPYWLATYLVSNYEHDSHNGKLRISFFNDRLMSVWFYPYELESYSKNVLMFNKEPKMIGENVWFRTYVDHEAQEYYSWEDQRIADQFESWIRKYS